MKLKNRNRSSLTINAVAQAAAQGAATALLPGRKLTAVAALAGFVLRLFRRSEGTTDAVRTECGGRVKPERYGRDAGTIRERYRSDTAAKRSRTGNRPARPGAVATKGGPSHG